MLKVDRLYIRLSSKTENFLADALVCYAWRHWRDRVARKNLPRKFSVLPEKRT